MQLQGVTNLEYVIAGASFTRISVNCNDKYTLKTEQNQHFLPRYCHVKKLSKHTYNYNKS